MRLNPQILQDRIRLLEARTQSQGDLIRELFNELQRLGIIALDARLRWDGTTYEEWVAKQNQPIESSEPGQEESDSTPADE